MAHAHAPSRSFRAPSWISAALLLAVFVVFGQTYHHEFIVHDDDHYITKNPMVLRGLTFEGLRWSMTATIMHLWSPLTVMSHMLDVQLFGLHPGLHHLESVFFHGLNAVLVFQALRLLTGDTWRSATVAALFAVHPLRVESVAWASERKDLLSAMFFLLALCVYSRYVRTRERRDYALLLVCFVLGIAAKPMVITLPFVLMLIDYWPLRREMNSWWSLRALLLEKRSLFLIAAAAAVWTAWCASSLETYPTGARVANAIVAYAKYVEQTVAPIHLAIMYPHPGANISWEAVAAGAAVVGGITIAVMLLWQRHPYALIGWLWFLGMLVPVIGLVQVGVMAHADRFTYLPHIGLFLGVVWTTAEVTRSSELLRRAMPAVAVVVLVVFAAMGFFQVGHWRNSITLFEHTVRISPDSNQAHVNLGTAYSAINRLDLAESHFRRALEIHPRGQGAKFNLGTLLLKLHRPEEAAGLFAELVEADRRKPQYHVQLAVALYQQGRPAEALSPAQEALRINPNDERAKALVGQCRRALQLGS